jgi:uncharacterized membrane protein (TIGR02234 family)
MLRRLTHATVAGLAGAGLALYGATRVWAVEVTPRPGLSDLRTSTTGADAQPWLVALALIALAGPGALLATRGLVRRLLGGLLALVGTGVAAAAIAGRASIDPGAAGAGATVWPAACVLGGALVVLTGVSAARHGHEWPAMGSRYERRPVPPPRTGPAARPRPSPAAGQTGDAGAKAPGRAGDASSGATGPISDAGVEAAGGTGQKPAGMTGISSEKPSAAAWPDDRADAGGASAAEHSEGLPAAGPDGEPDDYPAGADERRADPAPIDTRAVWDALDRGDDPTR